MTTRDVVFLCMFVTELDYSEEDTTPLSVDNKVSIKLILNKILLGRFKTVQLKRTMYERYIMRTLFDVVGSL